MALTIFLFLVNFFKLERLMVAIKLIIFLADVNLSVLRIFNPTVGVNARKIKQKI